MSKHNDPIKQREYNRRHYEKKKAEQMARGEEKKVLQSMRFTTSIVARVRRLVNEAIAEGTYPWKDMSSAYQGLIIKGLESMAGDEMIDGMLPYLRMVQSTAQLKQNRQEAQAVFQSLKMEVSEMLAIKATEHAIRHVHTALAVAEEIDGSVWQQWLVGKIKETFPDLLKQKPRGVRLDTDRSEKPIRKAQKGVRYTR